MEASAMISGLEQLKQRSEEIQKAREARRVSNFELKLKADEIAHLRILSDAPDIKSGLFHGIPRTTAKGSIFTDSIFCTMPEAECQYCLSEDPDIRSRKVKLYIWVYVYYILHKKAPANVEVEEVKRAGLKFFKENINAVRYIRTGEGWGSYISNKFIQLYQKYGTLLDRDYEWIRQGETMANTVYDLLQDDASPISPEIQEVMSKLPPLEKLVRGEPVEIEGVKVGSDGVELPSQKEEELPLLERLRQSRGK